jgi:drug/metabolite transporter (DMT)-like permease
LGWQELLGGALILGGVWIAQKEEPKIVEELADPDLPKGV